MVEELPIEPDIATRAPQGRNDAPAVYLPPVLVVEVGPGSHVHVSVWVLGPGPGRHQGQHVQQAEGDQGGVQQ